MRDVSFVLVVVAIAVANVACSDSPGLPQIAVDASRSAFPDPPANDGAIDGDADVDASCVPGADAAAEEGGTTFDDLYRDLFRHDGVAKCQTAVSCHGGSTSVTGFPMGSTSHDLYCAFTSHVTAGKHVVASGSTNRADSFLLTALTPTADGPAFMPDTTHCDLHNRKLDPDELARIGQWLDHGGLEVEADAGTNDTGPCPDFAR